MPINGLNCGHKCYESPHSMEAKNNESEITNNDYYYCYNERRIVRAAQEGQHPLTGQRAANFRLLANQ